MRPTPLRLAMPLALASCAASASHGASSPSDKSACGPDEALLLGACVSGKTADAYCGVGARYAGGGCVFRACEAAHALSVTTGECAPMRALRDVASADGAAFFEGEALECDDGGAPIVDAGHVACPLGDGACPRGAHRAGASCEAPPRCARGELYDERARVCVRVVGGEGVVDLATWLRVAIGPDGGDGTVAFCQPLALHTGALGVSPGGTLDARVSVDVRAPDNDVTAAYVTVEQAGASPPSGAAALLEERTRPMIDALHALGDLARETSATSARVTVRCVVHAGARPRPIPLPQASASVSVFKRD